MTEVTPYYFSLIVVLFLIDENTHKHTLDLLAVFDRCN